MGDVLKMPADQLRFGIPQELAQRLIHPEETAIERFEGDTDRRMFECGKKRASVTRCAASLRIRAVIS